MKTVWWSCEGLSGSGWRMDSTYGTLDTLRRRRRRRLFEQKKRVGLFAFSEEFYSVHLGRVAFDSHVCVWHGSVSNASVKREKCSIYIIMPYPNIIFGVPLECVLKGLDKV